MPPAETELPPGLFVAVIAGVSTELTPPTG